MGHTCGSALGCPRSEMVMERVFWCEYCAQWQAQARVVSCEVE